MSSQPHDVVIIPGGWGSVWHFKPLVKHLRKRNLSAQVHTRKRIPQPARLVITHSVSSLEPWEKIAGEAVLFAGPINMLDHPGPLTDKTIRNSVIRARLDDLNWQRRNKRMRRGSLTAAKGLVSSIQDPGLVKHQRRLLQNNDFQDRVTAFARSNPDIRLVILRYAGDLWTHQDTDQLAEQYPNISIRVLEKPHDDILYNPAHYAALAEELLS